MAFKELISDFNQIRAYMREFYVYGFKTRSEYALKGDRTYDDQQRRINAMLGNFMQFRTAKDGKRYFISIDTRVINHNPLYSAWKSKTFTDSDITLYFYILDILRSADRPLSKDEIIDRAIEYLSSFSPEDSGLNYEQEDNLEKHWEHVEKTYRIKLTELLSEGIIRREKRGRAFYYSPADAKIAYNPDVLNFFSEVSPCGVIGSFLLDRQKASHDCFSFKHHYITGTLDSDIVCSALDAMSEKKTVELTVLTPDGSKRKTVVVPVKIMCSTRNGRQYLAAYDPQNRHFLHFRTDRIETVKKNKACQNFDRLRSEFDAMQSHMWGVDTPGTGKGKTEHVEFIIEYPAGSRHTHMRLEREKRCGTVEQLSETSSRFSADVISGNELIPWISTFIGAISYINFSNKNTEQRFRDRMNKMYSIYDI